jgi:hypothetical protein
MSRVLNEITHPSSLAGLLIIAFSSFFHYQISSVIILLVYIYITRIWLDVGTQGILTPTHPPIFLRLQYITLIFWVCI